MEIPRRIIESIEKIGLSDKESLVYTTLLRLGGGAFPSKIAEKSGLKRSTVYKILLDMSIKGVINEIEKKNKLYYQVEKPQKLLRFAKDNVRIAEDQVEIAEKVLPELEGLFSLTQNKPKVTFFEGIDGVLEVYQDHVNVSEKYEMVAWANAGRLREFLPPKFFKEYVKAKEKIGITTRGIIPGTDLSLTFLDAVYKDIQKPIWPHMRFIDTKLFPYDAEITVYGKNKVSIAKVGESNLIGVIIEDSIIHGMMRMIFELSWNGSKDFLATQ